MDHPLGLFRDSSQVVVVVVESSATAPSLLASILASSIASLDFSSISGVFGGAAFGDEPPVRSAWSGPGSGVPLVIGSGVVSLGVSGVGVRAFLLSGVGVVALGEAGLGSRPGLAAGFGSAGLRLALGSGLGAGLSLTSAGLGTSKFSG